MLKIPTIQHYIDKYSDSITKLADQIPNPHPFKERNQAKLDIKASSKLIINKLINERINKSKIDRAIQTELENLLQAI